MISPPSLASRALRDTAINHTVTNLLLAVVVGGFNVVGEHETKVILRKIVFLQCIALVARVLHRRETRSEIAGLFRRWRTANQLQEAIAMRHHRAMKAFFGHLVASVPSREQSSRSIQQLLGPGFSSTARERVALM